MNENESKSVVKDEGTSGTRSEWGGSWWQLIALMSVSAVMVTGISELPAVFRLPRIDG